MAWIGGQIGLLQRGKRSMKYFMSVFSPSRNARRVFLMSRVSAEYYYGDYLRKFGRAHIYRCLETGARTVCPHNDVHIWGEDISDSELFKRRLNGSVDPSDLECPL